MFYPDVDNVFKAYLDHMHARFLDWGVILLQNILHLSIHSLTRSLTPKGNFTPKGRLPCFWEMEAQVPKEKHILCAENNQRWWLNPGTLDAKSVPKLRPSRKFNVCV